MTTENNTRQGNRDRRLFSEGCALQWGTKDGGARTVSAEPAFCGAYFLNKVQKNKRPKNWRMRQEQIGEHALAVAEGNDDLYRGQRPAISGRLTQETSTPELYRGV